MSKPQKIVLIEIDNGDYVEGEAFKNLDSLKGYLKEIFEDQYAELEGQIEDQLNRGSDILELEDEYGRTVKAFTQYPLY
tara:strand:- start:38270 stop:38506 length:237 start_codon:yes stop_codon:yes gene_type:complete